MKREDLDKRICDVDPNSTNTDTYREYIDWGYRYIGWRPIGKDLYERTADLDKMTDEELTDVLEELDWLLEK